MNLGSIPGENESDCEVLASTPQLQVGSLLRVTQPTQKPEIRVERDTELLRIQCTFCRYLPCGEKGIEVGRGKRADQNSIWSSE